MKAQNGLSPRFLTSQSVLLLALLARVESATRWRIGMSRNGSEVTGLVNHNYIFVFINDFDS